MAPDRKRGRAEARVTVESQFWPMTIRGRMTNEGCYFRRRIHDIACANTNGP